MDDTQKTDVQTTSPESEKETTSPEVQENVEESNEVDTQPSSEVDVKEDTGKGEADTPKPEWENEKKSMAGKISQLEKERNEYLQAKQLVDALDSAAANDPEFMRMANKKLVEQGLLDESVLESVGEGETKSVETVDPAIKWAQQKMQEEQNKRVEFFNNFEEKHPDLSQGDPNIVKANRSAIGAAAAKNMAETGSSMEDAYEFAYKLIMTPNQLIEDGKLQGIAQAQSASPVEGAASGGSSNSSGGVKLTPEQKEAARLFGISEEKYAKNLEE